MKRQIALVFMADEEDNFFIEDPPPSPPEKWIERYACVDCVEYVWVIGRGATVTTWSNPNVAAEP